MTRLRAVAFNALFLDPGVSGGTETYLRSLVPAIAAERPGPAHPRADDRPRRAGAGATPAGRSGPTSSPLRADEGRRLRRLAGEQVAVPARLARRRRRCTRSPTPARCDRPCRTCSRSTTSTSSRTHALSRASASPTGVMVPPPRAAPTAWSRSRTPRATRSRACSALARRSLRRRPARRRPRRRSIRCPRRRCARGTGSTARASCCASPPSARTRTRRRCCARSRSCRADVVVVLAGHAEAYDARLRRARGRARRAGARAVRRPDARDAELEALWRLAACAAFPTLAEGFGLPVVEAMRRGVPVACSDLPVLREVGGDVPRLLRSRRPRRRSPRRCCAATGSDRGGGAERAAGFTWEAAASGTLEAYERALA